MANYENIREDLVKATQQQFGLNRLARKLIPPADDGLEGLNYLMQNRKNVMITDLGGMQRIAKAAGEVVEYCTKIVHDTDPHIRQGTETVHRNFTNAFEGTNDNPYALAVLNTTGGQLTVPTTIVEKSQETIEIVNDVSDEDGSEAFGAGKENLVEVKNNIAMVGHMTVNIVQNVNSYLAQQGLPPITVED